MVLVLAVAIGVVAFYAERWWPPAGFPSAVTTDADRLAAEAALFGGGAFTLAAVATVIAIIAFVNSTEKPSLSLTDGVLLAAARDEWERMWTHGILLENHGRVAARFVAVRVTIEGAVMNVAAGGVVAWRTQTITSVGITVQAIWEGGADAVVHPGWTYEVPPLGPYWCRCFSLRQKAPDSWFTLRL